MKTFGWKISRVALLGMETWNVYRYGTLVGTFMSRVGAEALIIRVMGAL